MHSFHHDLAVDVFGATADETTSDIPSPHQAPLGASPELTEVPYNAVRIGDGLDATLGHGCPLEKLDNVSCYHWRSPQMHPLQNCT